MNLLTWPERLINRLTGNNKEEKPMTEPTATQSTGMTTEPDQAAVTGVPTTAAELATHNQALSDIAAENARIAAEHGLTMMGTLDFDVLRGILAAIGYDIPRDRFESAVFLATSDAKTHG